MIRFGFYYFLMLFLVLHQYCHSNNRHSALFFYLFHELQYGKFYSPVLQFFILKEECFDGFYS